MKLKYFSEQTLPRTKIRGGSSIPRVAFSSQGVIAINNAACKLMGLKAGSKITLVQDEEDVENFYFFLDPQHGFALREDKKNTCCLFTHKAMVELLAEARGLDPGKRIKAMIAGQPTILKGDKAATKYWGILVKPQI